MTKCPKKVFGELFDPRKYIFNLPFEKDRLPDYIKIAKVTTAQITDSADLKSYRPASVFPCFFLILERLMYN